MTEENEEKTSRFDDFATSSLRGPKQSTREQLLCMKLFRANKSFPLRRIQSLCEASFYAKQMRPKIKIDMNLIETIYKTALSLGNVKPNKILVGWKEYVTLWPVPWAFNKTKENYERFIHPWAKDYNYFRRFVQKIPDLEENRISISCSHCGGVLLDLLAVDKPKTREFLLAKFKDKVMNSKQRLIDEKTYEYRRRLQTPIKGESYPPRELQEMKNWRPPSKTTFLFGCPTCTGQIILGTRTKADTFWGLSDRIREGESIEVKGILIKDYSHVVENRLWQLFFAASHYLSQDGFFMLINAFVAWANPQVTRIEEAITGLVSKETFTQFFKEAQEKEEQQEE